ncbi:MAG TPA: GlsB/YeaQ/YmgE family stress response membrane protein [Opitutaceae bacterium]|jgi:uncharacterized membrane protein YeaQ/YmgE (transglycosylase-associated protein family)|nr:GlsB/YeaQ/YmgE family stress response membrane protein [Opitutaceae bacterium]HXB01891.1 GlsB/YeaQ/YmgE family stress response membrane protein [Opitutaceae bacterium]
MTLQEFIIFLLVGAVAGWLSGLITKGSGFGLAGNVIVGIIGAFLGNLLFGLVGIAAYGLLGHIIFAVVGALLFVYLLRFIKK